MEVGEGNESMLISFIFFDIVVIILVRTFFDEVVNKGFGITIVERRVFWCD